MRKYILLAGAVAALFVATLPVQAQKTYRITVNTSGIAAESGFLEAQFNSGGGDALAASVAISNFSFTNGTTGTNITRTGEATGAFRTGGTLGNGVATASGFNALSQDFAVGTTGSSGFAFDVVFTGVALSPGTPRATGSTFALSLYRSDNVTPFPNTAPDAQTLGAILLNGDGTLNEETFNAMVAAAPQISIAPVVVPEAGTVVLFAVGVAGFMATRRQKRERKA